MSNWAGVSATDGTEQNDRFPQALRDDYFRVDEMPFEDLLSLMEKFAARLKFFNTDKAQTLTARDKLEQAVDGDWSDLFTSDDVVIMAGILSTDLKHLRSTLLQKLDEGAQSTGAFIFSLARLIDGWLKGLGAIDDPSAEELRLKINEIVRERLGADLFQLDRYFERDHAGARPLGWRISVFHESWTERRTIPDPLPDPGSRAGARDFLEATGDSFLHSIAYLQSIVPRHLAVAMKSEKHNPAIGLFIAFLRLFQRAQANVNTMTARHMDFYYKNVLKVAPRASIPDSAWLALKADATIQAAFVPQGTPFAAGKDQNDDEIIFLADNNLGVTDARVSALYTLCLERDPLISPEKELGYVTRSRAHQFAAIGGRDEIWPVFGSEIRETRQGVAEDAQIGFAISSPILHLREGTRTLIVDLDFSDRAASDGTATILLGNLVAVHAQLSDNDLVLALTELFARYLVSQPHLSLVGHNAEEMASSVDLARVRLLLQTAQQTRLYDVFLLELLERAASEESFFRIFGWVFRRSLLGRYPEGREILGRTEKQRILAKASLVLMETGSEVSIRQITELFSQSRDVLFSRLLRNAFAVSMTSPEGWYDVAHYTIAPLPYSEISGGLGLRCTFLLESDASPIVACDPLVHGTSWDTTQPVIRFRLNALSVFYHYSPFDGLLLREAALECRVQGIKTFLAYNNEGQLDPSKPFLPFGALPARNSYFIVGQPEIARKNVYELRLNIEWGGLPPEYGGFRNYYRTYDLGFDNDVFQVAVSSLRDGEWQPADRTQRRRLKLFESKDGEIISETTILPIDASFYLKPIPSTTRDEDFAFDLKTRNGFVNLTLVAPDEAFGHRDYSPLLTRILTENAKHRRRRPKPLPNAPYTPAINRLTIDYVARDVIGGFADTTGTPAQKIYQLHPFGVRTVYPASAGLIPQLLPAYPFDGNLFIGIEASQLQGVLTLLFHMAEDSTRDAEGDAQPPIVWSYLSGDHWRRLEPARVLSDTTRGFLKTGVVTLDIPADIQKGNTILPAELFWLTAATNGNLEKFSSLYAVYTHGLRVTRQLSAAGFSGTHVSEGTIRQVRSLIPGLTEITQISDSFGGRMQESDKQMKTRISERLRHKNRATSPWDYERLVLDRFPEVFKVKCFPTLVSHSRQPRPGHIMVVVIPASRNETLSPRLDAVELGAIQAFLQSVSSPSVKITVRNPNYERIQVRCAVKFKHPEAPGLQVSRLNAEIVDFISPWTSKGLEPRFGWSIRSEDVQSYVTNLDFVDFVTDFSVLHLTDDGEGNYSLGDTARFSQITLGSFRDFPRLISRLRQAQDSVSVFLLEQFRPHTVELVLQSSDAEPGIEVSEAVLEGLNSILEIPLYTPERFAHVTLQDDTRRRLGQVSNTGELIALNRCLLEDWGENIFETCPARTQEIRPRYPWSIAIPMDHHWIETIAAREDILAQHTGIAELEVISTFIIS